MSNTAKWVKFIFGCCLIVLGGHVANIVLHNMHEFIGLTLMFVGNLLMAKALESDED
jgi:hypothetical protein